MRAELDTSMREENTTVTSEGGSAKPSTARSTLLRIPLRLPPIHSHWMLTSDRPGSRMAPCCCPCRVQGQEVLFSDEADLIPRKPSSQDAGTNCGHHTTVGGDQLRGG
jgi:hypothetical protein